MKNTMLPLMLSSAMLPVGATREQLAPLAECRSGGYAYEVVDPLFDASVKNDHVPGVVYGVVLFDTGALKAVNNRSSDTLALIDQAVAKIYAEEPSLQRLDFTASD
jgi:hypothetical protein